jgi:hypothetical protein
MGYLIGWRARSGIERDPLGAFAAGIFVGLFTDLAFAKAGDRCRDSVSDPVIDAGAVAACRPARCSTTIAARRMILPSANVVDLSVKSSAASAAAVAKPNASVIMLAAKIRSVIMVFL